MQAELCDRCRETFSKKWKTSFIGQKKSYRIGWRGTLSRFGNQNPCLTYVGRMSVLRASPCPMCQRIFQHLEHQRINGKSGRQGRSSEVAGEVESYVVGDSWFERAHHCLASWRIWGARDGFVVRLEHVLSGRNSNHVFMYSGSDWHSSWFRVLANHDTPAAQSIPSRPGLWDTLDVSTLDFVHSWIDECNSSHLCGTPGSSTTVPKRVLELSTNGSDIEIKLVDTATISSVVQYVALSYCWGEPTKHHQVLTLKTNINDHQRNISFSDLPKTIQDAVTICNKLSIRWLWVDALCIIQDDDQDKLSEIASMGFIYENAYLTVAASCAEGVADGFLESKYNPFFTAPIQCSDRKTMEAQWCWYGEGLLNSSTTIIRRGSRPQSAKAVEPLHQRGWAFQELMLSRRILLFSSFQPYWICRQASHSGGEPYPEEFFTAIGLQDILPSLKGDISKKAASFGYLWPWVAENYSERVLSELNDKLLAIHAVKGKYREVGSTYCAGVWLENFAIDILWSTVRRHKRTPQELKKFGKDYHEGRIVQLPSWSWLSFDGTIKNELVWHAFNLGAIASKEEVKSHINIIRFPTTDIFGRITGPPLRIRGRIKKLVMIPAKGKRFSRRNHIQDSYRSEVWNQETNTFAVESSQIRNHRIGYVALDDFVSLPEHRENAQFNDYDFSEDHDAPPLLLDCLVVATVNGREGRHSQKATLAPQSTTCRARCNKTAYGLLLVDVPHSNERQKSRIASFRGVEGLSDFFDDSLEVEFDFV